MILCLVNFWYYYFYANMLLVINCENNVQGIATEAQMILNSTHHGIPDALLDYYAYQNHRTCIGAALTKLEQELTCKTTGNAGTLTDSTKKPMGYGLNNKSIFVSSSCKYHYQITDI